MGYSSTETWPDPSPDALGRHRDLAPQRAWLEHFPPTCRSTIANWFHNNVRGGATRPEVVVWYVQREILSRLGCSTGHVVDPHLQAILDLLEADRAGALAYAKSVLAYEQLPYDSMIKFFVLDSLLR